MLSFRLYNAVRTTVLASAGIRKASGWGLARRCRLLCESAPLSFTRRPSPPSFQFLSIAQNLQQYQQQCRSFSAMRRGHDEQAVPEWALGVLLVLGAGYFAPPEKRSALQQGQEKEDEKKAQGRRGRRRNRRARRRLMRDRLRRKEEESKA